ncbi:hypothetical protein K491DRAFT_690217 [Lophiostoma macrostomum CBS 122681]|uniref:F-box domain-containing protein n=1 Tax=Lophiostoma macrostomum CBS 122681 TaxID=1314788 RepID=A0A6A6THZ0_9PLEO|nr:hypothetical protein K491DRAFT_690217 [Lophiostoma macrostomum CBS 122681]
MASNSALLSLPLELRLLIYESLWIAITQPHLDDGPQLPRQLPPTSSSSKNLSLLQTCRQIYAEAYRIAYSRHTFTICRNLDLSMPIFDPNTPASPHALIRTLLIPGHLIKPRNDGSYDSVPGFYPFKLLCQLIRRLPALTTIVIGVNQYNLMDVQRQMTSRKAHLSFRLRKANRLKDDRFLPSYDLKMLDQRYQGVQEWRIKLRGKDENGERWKRSADMLIVQAAP